MSKKKKKKRGIEEVSLGNDGARLIQFERGAFWIIKYACTRGIYKIEGERSLANPDYVRPVNGSWQDAFYGEDREWCRTLKKARQLAEYERRKKIAALAEQMSKLGKLRFDKETPYEG